MELSVFSKVNKSFCPGIVQLTEAVIQLAVLAVSLFSPVTSRLFIPLDFDTNVLYPGAQYRKKMIYLFQQYTLAKKYSKMLSLLKKVLKIAKDASSGNVFG